jgi:glycosylphosphatidylinositol transamidase (GPIT) subunit GPI8
MRVLLSSLAFVAFGSHIGVQAINFESLSANRPKKILFKDLPPEVRSAKINALKIKLEYYEAANKGDPNAKDLWMKYRDAKKLIPRKQ